MKRTPLIGFLGVFAAGALCGAGELRIAVLDFHRAFNSYGRRDELLKELETRKESMNEELAKLEKSLQSKQSDLETLQPGTDAFRDFQLKLIELEALIQVTKRQYDMEYEKLRQAHMKALFEDVEKEVRAYAREKELDLVLARFSADPRVGGPLFVTIYSKPELDITDDIIGRLNRSTEK